MPNLKSYWIYILTNKTNNVLYIGFTGQNLRARVWQHKEKITKGFTNKYNINKLVYYECFDDPLAAITREKQLKGGSRAKKLSLIQEFNPNWQDLYYEISK